MRDSEPEFCRPALTAGMRAVLRGMQRPGAVPMERLDPAQARAVVLAGSRVLEENAPAGVHWQDGWISARDGRALAVRLYRPQDTAAVLLPAVLYLHGGGFVTGGIETHHVLCARLAQGAQAAVLSLDYRLAPEHRFPVAVNDTWDALQWLHDKGAAWGLDTGRLAVAGDSAGGTLAAVAALMARDTGIDLRAQCLIYPGTTAHQESDSHRRFASGPLLSQALLRWFFEHYIDAGQRQDWRFAPLLAPEHEGVAAALLLLAECDPLVDEGRDYADCLRMARVPVDLEIYRGVAHDFIRMGRLLPEAGAAHRRLAEFLRERFQP